MDILSLEMLREKNTLSREDVKILIDCQDSEDLAIAQLASSVLLEKHNNNKLIIIYIDAALSSIRHLAYTNMGTIWLQKNGFY